MRRVFVFLLALVLAPSIATASQFQCALDGATRTECCCPAPPHHDDAPTNVPIARSACCCTVIQAAELSHSTWSAPSAFEQQAFIVPETVTVMPAPPTAIASAVTPRPLAQGDPPSTLLACHCALLI